MGKRAHRIFRSVHSEVSAQKKDALKRFLAAIDGKDCI